MLDEDGNEDLSKFTHAQLNERLWEHASTGDIDGARSCLDAGASPKSKSGGERTTPLMRACIRGHAAMAALLVPMSNLDDVDRDGATAAMRCCQEGQAECLRVLIAAKADLEKRDKRGDSPLFRAVRYGAQAWEDGSKGLKSPDADELGRVDCLDLLLGAGDLRARDANGETASDIARGGDLPDLMAAIDARLLAASEKATLSKLGQRKAAMSEQMAPPPRTSL